MSSNQDKRIKWRLVVLAIMIITLTVINSILVNRCILEKLYIFGTEFCGRVQPRGADSQSRDLFNLDKYHAIHKGVF